MGRSFLGGLISTAVKAADRAIKQAKRERERQAKIAERQAKIAERERKRNEKAEALRNYSIKLNGVSYSRNLLEDPVTDAEIESVDRKIAKVRQHNKSWQKKMDKLGELSEKGQQFEENGEIDKAIKAYRKAVEYGQSTKGLHFVNYARDIDRLAILYRKQKAYQEEVDILNVALSHDMHPNHSKKYQERLEKAQHLLEKSQTKK